MKPAILTSLVLGAAFVTGAAIYLNSRQGVPPSLTLATDPVGGGGVGDASQVIEITVKGGYAPATARAKAGAPLALKMKTNGTLDCSVQVRIPGIGWSQNLPPTGEATVQIPAQKAGTTLTGVCSMGMYNFTITFE
jgi:hypothetical protein